MVFGVFDFLQKMNERIRLYYYDNSSRLVFVRFLEEIEDNKKPFRNYLTFNFKNYFKVTECLPFLPFGEELTFPTVKIKNTTNTVVRSHIFTCPPDFFN